MTRVLGAERERHEGMLVHFAQELTVSGNQNLPRFGELVLSANGRIFVPNHQPGEGKPTDQASRRLILDDASTRGRTRAA